MDPSGKTSRRLYSVLGGRGALGVVVLVCLVSACAKAPAGDPAKEAVFLVSPQEGLALQASVRRVIRRLGSSGCARPVLRGRPVAARPDPLVIDLVEARGSLAGCAAWVGAHEAEVRRLGSGEGAGADDLERLRRRCPGLLRNLARVVRFGAVCSPYLPGRRRLPDFLALVRLQQAAAALALGRARAHPDEAQALLLDLLRFHQDLERGGTPWIWSYVLRSATKPVVVALGTLLASGRLTSAQRRSLDTGLQRLLASEPALGAHVTGERIHVEYTTFLRPMSRASRRLDVAAGMLRGDQGHLLAWLAYRLRAQRFERACPPSLPPRYCYARFRALEGEPGLAAREQQERWEQFEWWLAAGHLRGKQGAFDRAAARAAALAMLGRRSGIRHSAHLLRAAQRAFYLVALRLHVAVLDARETHARPVTVQEVEALARAHPDPFWDAPPLVEGNPGAVTLRPPQPLAPRGEPAVRYVMRWPARRAPTTPR